MTNETKKKKQFGTRLPSGFNGSQMETVEGLFDMTLSTIRTQGLFHGWTVELTRTPLGEWRYTITGKDKNE